MFHHYTFLTSIFVSSLYIFQRVSKELTHSSYISISLQQESVLQSVVSLIYRGTKENSKPMKRLLGLRSGAREPITRKINNEVDFQDGIVRVNAPQFQLLDIPLRLLENITAGDVVLRQVLFNHESDCFQTEQANVDVTNIRYNILVQEP
jgi:hypothetical protein